MMNINKQTTSLIAGGAGLLLLGLLLGALFFSGGSSSHADHSSMSDEEMQQHVEDEHTDEQGNIVYTCSMHPSVREDEPVDCPICGMDLIPASSDDAGDDPAAGFEMRMSPAAVQLANIQTTPVQRATAARDIHLPGRIEVDERRQRVISSYVEGRITELHIDFTGAPIERGQPLASLYSPELMSAQRELLQAADRREREPERYESALRKFRLWNIAASEIQRVLEAGEVLETLTIHAPASGYVSERHVSTDSFVQPGTVLFEIADARDLWLSLEAYEEDLPWLAEGDRVTFSPRGSSARHEAHISFIDPGFDTRSRSIRVRADVSAQQPESGGSLRPGMLVSASVEAEMTGEHLLVPASAVLWTGPRSLVYVQPEQEEEERPRFQVREVVLGPRAGDFYVIEDAPDEGHDAEAHHHERQELPEYARGVQEGERVVFNGAFRIDSEMQLADRFSMMNRKAQEEEDEERAQVDVVDGVSEVFQQEMVTFVEHYLEAKDALFSADAAAMPQAVERMQARLSETGKHRNDGEAHMQWMDDYEALEESLEELAQLSSRISSEAEAAEGAHQAFSTLSDQLIEMVRRYNIPGVVYHQYCPMEDKNWLSSEEDIQNPYAPETMPRCGEVIERIGE